MDLSDQKLDALLNFYRGLCTLWGMFEKQRLESSDSLYWLLKELVVHGICFVTTATVGSTVLKQLCLAKVTTLKHVVDFCGPYFDNAASLASHLVSDLSGPSVTRSDPGNIS